MKYTYEKIDDYYVVYINGQPEYKFPTKNSAAQFCRSMNRINHDQ